ncbi:unnamed protein product [Allacma fusca]|uniref:Uncharacterized protein n=1 Tax=Allacma fusca TaxID=39272 RepID=A0A8J2P528_9HEXA|nr:unnamed protein product [Allacma fusca]
MLLRHDFFCGIGTVFDTNLSVCNHPSMVHVSAGCQLKFTGGRIVPTIPPMQGLQGNSVDLETSAPPGGRYGYYYSEPEMLIQPRVNSIPSRKWPNKYIVANRGPLVHVQVQVPYTMNT